MRRPEKRSEKLNFANMRNRIVILFILLLSPIFWRCDDGFNLFSIQDDLALGLQVRDEILANSAEFPVIPRNANPSAYAYIEQMRDNLLASGAVKYRNEFPWEIYLLKDDNVLNAFCVPGGFIFIYSGLIKFLDSDYKLAGVLGHEIAHADRRHSTRQLTRLYGVSILLELALGQNQGVLTELASGLLFLEFSRSQEREADEYSVRYLCNTPYRSDGASYFFEQLIALGQGSGVPTFLSTHPDPGNRVRDIRDFEQSLSCTHLSSSQQAYMNFRNSL
jgi:beta-barrel assembly-enhancing protease